MTEIRKGLLLKTGQQFVSFFLVAIVLLLSQLGFADFDPEESLLFPAGMGTADVLRPTEWMITSPPWGWMAYGLSERVTLGLDYQTTLFGFPAALARVQLNKSQDVQYAVEGYGVYFGSQVIDKRDPKYLVDHRGGQEWLRFARTQILSPRLRFHAYVGANYADFTKYGNNESARFVEQTFENQWTPIAGIALEWKMAQWVTFNINATSGNTFYYFDQIAHKNLFAYSFLMAPFPKTWSGFFSRMRLELTALWVNIPAAEYNLSVPIPISPVIYWQFGAD